MMEEASLFSLPEGMRVERIQITEHGLVIEIKVGIAIQDPKNVSQQGGGPQ